MTLHGPEVMIPSGCSRIFCYVFHPFPMTILSIIIFLFSVSPAHCEKSPPKKPISLEQIEQEFVSAKGEKRPVKIENRIIEGSALEYLNDNLSDGPGIHIENCKIEGDLNFVKHAKPISEVKDRLDDKKRKHLDGVRAARVEVINQEISILASDVQGSLGLASAPIPLPIRSKRKLGDKLGA